jgi:hypothetical protein
MRAVFASAGEPTSSTRTRCEINFVREIMFFISVCFSVFCSAVIASLLRI